MVAARAEEGRGVFWPPHQGKPPGPGLVVIDATPAEDTIPGRLDGDPSPGAANVLAEDDPGPPTAMVARSPEVICLDEWGHCISGVDVAPGGDVTLGLGSAAKLDPAALFALLTH